MKNARVLFLAAVCFLWSNLFAEEHRDAWANQSFQNNPYQKVKFIGYGDTTYTDTVQFIPLPYCFTPSNPPDTNSIVVKSLRERIDRFVEDNSYGPVEINHDHLFRVIEIKYTIKCVNNLRYEGIEYLISWV